ncbi:hypothetical protein L208DRAFT_1412010 [Tricholoma matsutake]|nr:hypothetical protein L208DRAFT_1412010 [Tricholoma matsutake 945]
MRVERDAQPRSFDSIAYSGNLISLQWGIGIATPLIILGGTLGAAVVAILHYSFDAYLNGKPASGFWNQLTTHRFENALATVFALLFSMSAGVSLCQMSWYIVRRKSFPIRDLDLLLGPPTWRSLLHARLVTQLPFITTIVIAITASPLIPVFAPSLTVHPGNPYVHNITVPTLDLATDNNLQAFHISNHDVYSAPSEVWTRTALRAIVADQTLGWPIPQDCAPECTYNVTYDAVALQCSDLKPDQIADGLTLSTKPAPSSPLAYLFGYDGNGSTFYVLNVSISDNSKNLVPIGLDPSQAAALSGRDQYGITLTYMTTSAIRARVPQGSICTLYNATHLAQVSYANGTQVSSVRVVEYHNPLNTTYRLFNLTDPNAPSTTGDPPPQFAPGTGRHVNLLAMADSLMQYLQGTMYINGLTGALDYNGTQTLITKTNLFSINSTALSGTLDLGEGITNVSQSLVEVVANATLNYMNLKLGSSSVVATSPAGTNVYQFKYVSLAVTYGIAVLILVITNSVGIVTLIKNGVPSSNEFSQVLVTTRNPTLDLCTTGACLGMHSLRDKSLGDIQLRFGEVAVGEGPRVRHAAFGVVDREVVGALQKNESYF